MAQITWYVEMQGDGCANHIKFERFSSIWEKIRWDIRGGLGQDESDDMWHHQILSDTGSEVSCDNRNFRKEDLRDAKEQVFDKEALVLWLFQTGRENSWFKF